MVKFLDFWRFFVFKEKIFFTGDMIFALSFFCYSHKNASIYDANFFSQNFSIFSIFSKIGVKIPSRDQSVEKGQNGFINNRDMIVMLFFVFFTNNYLIISRFRPYSHRLQTLSEKNTCGRGDRMGGPHLWGHHCIWLDNRQESGDLIYWGRVRGTHNSWKGK